MKSFAFLLAAATLLQSTSALPSANGVSAVGEAQHVEERHVHELEKRQTTSSARSRVLWKDRLVSLLFLIQIEVLISFLLTQSRCRFIFLGRCCFLEDVRLHHVSFKNSSPRSLISFFSLL